MLSTMKKNNLFLLFALVAGMAITISSCDKAEIMNEQQALELKKGKPDPTPPIVDLGEEWLATEVVADAVVDGTLTVTMKVTVTTDNTEEIAVPVKTQGGLTAKCTLVGVYADELLETELTAPMLKVKNNKKNTVISITEPTIDAGGETFVYYVVFTKDVEDIDCDVEDDSLTGDWSTKYEVEVVDMYWYTINPGELDEVIVLYTGWTDKLVGYAADITLADITTVICD